MPASHHQLQRSLAAMTIGVVKARDSKRANKIPYELQEGEQQFQLPITGTAQRGVTWAKKELTFDFLFYEATGYRFVPFDSPQFSHGFVIEPVDDKEAVKPIFVSAMAEYVRRDLDDAVTGAVMHVGVHSPTIEPVEFEGYLHLTFQGYGCPVETESGDE
mgnify:CR=1 FL=1